MYIVYADSNTFWVFDKLSDLRHADDNAMFPPGARILKQTGSVIVCKIHGLIAAHAGVCPECEEL